MKRKATSISKRQQDGIPALLAEVRQLISNARHAAASTVNTRQVLTNFEIGRRIVEHEQKGATRAKYGAELLKDLSASLTEEFGKGFSVTNLKLMRQFFLDYYPQIGQQPTDQFPNRQKATLKSLLPQKELLTADQSPLAPIPQHPIGKFQKSFTLSWTHYVLLLTIKDPDERSFYEIEATNQGWSVLERKRQKASALYERLALSRDKDGIRQLAAKGQIITKPEDVHREPHVLEFLGFDEKAESENDEK